jgi:putative aldouronate transport system permease protein
MKIKKSLGDHAFDAVNIVFMILFCLVILIPYWDMFIMSFTPGHLSQGLHLRLWTPEWSIAAYEFAFRNAQLINAYIVTIARALIGPTFSIFCCACFAYGLSKKELPFHNFLTIFILVPMFFSGGLIATYLLIMSIGLFNSFWVYIIPGSVSTFSIILLRNFFQNMDKGLEEAARIDGASYTKILFVVILPLSKPILATLFLMGAVSHWNSWFDTMLYINDQRLHTLAFVLRRLLMDDRLMADEMREFAMQAATTPFLTNNLRAAVTIITIAPIIALYPFLQKYFVKGIMLGALKG